MIVHNGGQPRPVRLPVRSHNEDVEFSVVRLPNLVRPFRTATEDQLVPVPIGDGALQSEGYESWVDRLDNLSHRRIAGRRQA